MTISYAGNFSKLLFRWKGSIWKSIWFELLIYLVMYYIVRLIYALLDEPHRLRTLQFLGFLFFLVSVLFNEYTKQIPLTFLLGFYVSLVVGRWWNQFMLVNWPEDIIAAARGIWRGDEEINVNTRHTIARYFNLSCVLVWRDISVKVRTRFPTMQQVLNSGLINEEELKIFESTSPEAVRWQLPLDWMQRLAENALQDGKLAAPMFTNFTGEIKSIRKNFRQLYCYDWVCVPLVYTQVAAIATYGYFFFCIIGRQFLDTSKGYSFNNIDFYVPIFTIVQFIFYIGWFKVGQDLMRPFGTDDDDVELNYIIDRNVATSFALVHDRTAPKIDDCKTLKPPLFDDNGLPSKARMPKHTKLSQNIIDHPPKLHAQVLMNDIKMSEESVPILPEMMTRREKSREKKRQLFVRHF